MQIKSLKITNFKNLKDFEINFDSDEPMTVVVGRNGAGKSNLLEAIIIIFRDFEVKVNNSYIPSFKYELSYIIRDFKVTIHANPYATQKKDNYKIKIQPSSGESFEPKLADFVAEDSPYLPKYVFGYYSGSTTRFEELFEKSQQIFRDKLLKGDQNPARRLFLAQPRIHSQFALLAFFQDEDETIPQFLRDELWIVGLQTVLFVIREPYWAKNKNRWGQGGRFWNAIGIVRPLIENIYRISTAPMVNSKRIDLALGRKKELEHLYLFLRDVQDLKKVASYYHSQSGNLDRKAFFNALEHIYMSDLLSEIRTKVFVQKTQESLTFRELSEGEQQLLMVLGLMRFTKEEEALFLLDEPDTHLNPIWTVNYLDFIKRVVGDTNTSHLIMTTHNPLTLASLYKEQVKILYREEETGKIKEKNAERHPRGMGVGSILTSDIFGLDSILDKATLQLIHQQRELAQLKNRNELQQAEFIEKTQQVRDLHIAGDVRDPDYEEFVKAITAYKEEQGIWGVSLTPEQIRKRDEYALNIIRKLKEKRGES